MNVDCNVGTAEASLIDLLVKGMVGHGDEYLGRLPSGSVVTGTVSERKVRAAVAA